MKPQTLSHLYTVPCSYCGAPAGRACFVPPRKPQGNVWSEPHRVRVRDSRQPSARTCVIWDLDNTLADLSHRLHHIRTNPKDWDAFHKAQEFDLPIAYTCQLFRILQAALPQVISTSRPDRTRDQTLEWLQQFGLVPHELHMRANADRRPDGEVKLEHLQLIKQNYTPLFAVEDRPSVVRMWRANGVPVLAMDDTGWLTDANESPLGNQVPTHLHLKRGTKYRLIGRSELQCSTGPVAEGTSILHYVGEDGSSWSRPETEFNDGRFQLLPEFLQAHLPTKE